MIPASFAPPVLLASVADMPASVQSFHHIVMNMAYISMYLLELLSISIIVFTTIVAFFKLFRHERYARVYLLHGQSLGLTFKLGAEILRTITATSLLDITEIFLLIVIKACMVVLIDRELRSADENDLSDHGTTNRTPEDRHKNHHPKEGKKYRFSLFHTETQLAQHSPEAEELQKEIDELRQKLQEKEEASSSV